MKRRIIVVIALILAIFAAYKVYDNNTAIDRLRDDYNRAYEGMMMLKDGEIITDAASILVENGITYINIKTVENALPQDYVIDAGKLIINPSQLDTSHMDDDLRNVAMFSDAQLMIPLAQRPSGQFIDSQTLTYISPLIIDDQPMVKIYSNNENIWTSYLVDDAKIYADEALTVDVYDLDAGENITVIDKFSDIYKVVTTTGRVGYVQRSHVSQLTPVDKRPYPQVGKARDTYGKLQMTFNHLTNYDAVMLTAFDAKINGLDVMMPTTLTANADGSVDSLIDMRYVNQLKSLGYRVHAVVSNGFQPDNTTMLLNDSVSVDRFANQIELYARFFGLDGISIDFENVYLKDQVAFTELVSKVYSRTSAMDIPLSVCVTRPGGSDMWSRFVDRTAVAEFSDYMILMAYDEHWSSSQTAGSVASLPWTASGIEAMLDEVPREKLILGVPTYMRAYTQPKDSDKLTSVAVSMKNFDGYIDPFDVFTKFDEDAGQNYYELRDSAGAVTKIWAEDKSSVTKRLDLINQYGLVGLASWRYGFETEDFWQLTQSKLK